MKKLFGALVLVIILMITIFYFGPKPEFSKVNPEISPLSYGLRELDSLITAKEDTVKGLKPENEATIVWYNDTIQKTPYALVYLHGFSASHMEGYPIHTDIATKYGMNLYLARMYGHGVDVQNNFKDLTPEKLMNSARFAIAVGNRIGENVIVMSCSTGGTYSIFLSAFNKEEIDAQILYSPNIALFNSSAKLLTGPWGQQIGKMVAGEERRISSGIGTEQEKYWTYVYRTEGIIALQDLLDQTMTEEVFSKVTQPTFLGYYYKNDSAMDSVVSVPAMRRFRTQAGVAESEFMEVPFPNVKDHVMASNLKSKDLSSVRQKTELFLEEMIGLVPADSLKTPAK